MDIIITREKSLKEISEEFHHKFPFLKLNFYSQKHEEGESSSLWDTLNPNLTIGQVGNFDHDREMSINGHLKVSTLEQRFQDIYSIGVQVMRKRGDEWIQTTATDEWTLTQQNRQGERESTLA